MVGRDLFPREILKVEWHPLSPTHVAVLTSDSTIRMYNLARNTTRPEQKFVLNQEGSSSSSSSSDRMPPHSRLDHHHTPHTAHRSSNAHISSPMAHMSSLSISPIVPRTPLTHSSKSYSYNSTPTTMMERSVNQSRQMEASGLFLSSEYGTDEDGDDRVVSFVFGRGHGWQRYSIFAATSSARIVLICPVVPFNCSIPESLLSMEELNIPSQSNLIAPYLTSVIEGYEQPFRQYDSIEELGPLGVAHSEFEHMTEDLIPHMPTSNHHSFAAIDRRHRALVTMSAKRTERYMRTQPPDMAQFKHRNIRPVVLHHSSQNAFGEDQQQQQQQRQSHSNIPVSARGRCVDMCLVTSTPASVTGISLLHIDGQINTSVLLGDVYPSFSNDAAESLTHSLELLPLDDVDLSLPEHAIPNHAKLRPSAKPHEIPSTPFLVPHCIDGSVFYCVNSAGVHQISFSAINMMQQELDPPIAVHIINTMPLKSSQPSAPAGFATFKHVLTGSYGIALDSSGQCHLVPTDSFIVQGIEREHGTIYDNILESYRSSEKLPKFTLPEITSLTPIRGDTRDGLDLLKIIISQFHQNHYEFIIEIHESTKRRLEELGKIKKSQEDMLREIKEKVSAQRKTQESLEQSLSTAMDTQEKLNRKIQSLLERVRYHQPTSIAEKAYSEIVMRCEDFLRNRKHRMETINDKLEHCVHSMQSTLSPHATFSRTQLSKIESSLEGTTKLVKKLNDRVKAIEDHLHDIQGIH